MIRECKESDFNTIFEIINDAAKAYKGMGTGILYLTTEVV